LEAAEIAVHEVAKMEGDEHFVFILSDANLKRYGIHPKEVLFKVSKVMNDILHSSLEKSSQAKRR
jgi:hypothetical protein